MQILKLVIKLWYYVVTQTILYTYWKIDVHAFEWLTKSHKDVFINFRECHSDGSYSVDDSTSCSIAFCYTFGLFQHLLIRACDISYAIILIPIKIIFCDVSDFHKKLKIQVWFSSHFLMYYEKKKIFHCRIYGVL